MSDKIYNVSADVARRAWIDEKKYQAMYERSVKDPDGFWAEQAKEFVTWSKPWSKVSDWSFDAKNLHIKWFEGGKLNVAYNCLDRHLAKRGNQTALIWEGDDPKDERKLPIASCTPRCAGLRTCSRAAASRRATACASTCQ